MKDINSYKGKKVLVVGLGRTGFALVNLFNKIGCDIKVTDIKPIFDLNKQVKRLKKITPNPQTTLGEHRNEDFLEADLIVYSSSIDPNLPQLKLAKENGREVYSEFGFAYKYCNKPVIAVCGSLGRTTIASMIGYSLNLDKKRTFVGGRSGEPFINYHTLPDKEEVDYVIVEVSPIQLKTVENFHPLITIFNNLEETKEVSRFKSTAEYIETSLSVLNNLTAEDYLVVNFDKLSGNSFLRNTKAQTFWYSRKSFVKMGVMGEVQGTHFHDMRIHSNVDYHSEFVVTSMRVVGQNNRENLLAAITACKILKVSDTSIQQCIAKFPGIPNRVEFVIEKNGVMFYNDSKSETMDDLATTLESFKEPVLLIAGGKEIEGIDYEKYKDVIKRKTRALVLVGENKESFNRVLGDYSVTFLVGSFDESVLLAYQKSRTGDRILLCPGTDGTDIFRDFEEKGNYFKKLVYQL